jgi:hypothetical protein
MRKCPWSGETVPETLGEYRDICKAIGGEKCRAVKYLDEKIAASEKAGDGGRDEKVIADDSQVRMLLMPMLVG